VPFSVTIKIAYPNMTVGVVGHILAPKQQMLQDKIVDIIFLAGEVVRTTNFFFRAAEESGVVVKTTMASERSRMRMDTDTRFSFLPVNKK
jgi:hypothetical protein